MILRLGWTALALLAGLLPASAASSGRCLRGVNLSGAEFGSVPGRASFDYAYPATQEIAAVAKVGATAIRLPVRWERLQPALDGPLDAAELARLDGTLEAASTKRLSVILDLHNFGRYGTGVLGTPALPAAAFADLWGRLAARYGRRSAVVFSLMNEPYDIPGPVWAAAANAALGAIRKAGARNLVLVSGAAWSGAHSWTADLATGNNGRDMLAVRDPLDRFAFDVHQYLDADFSGRAAECSGADRALAGIDAVGAWLKANGRRGFLGEFASSASPVCLAALGALAARIDADPDRWIGWTLWGAGSWWSSDYVFRIDLAAGGGDPQLGALRSSWRGPDGRAASCNVSDRP